MMTPKLFSQIFIIALSIFVFSSCKNSTTETTPPASLKGAYVLYENAHVGGSDYCYVDIIKDTVLNNVYENANGSAFFESPGKIRLIGNKNLYIVCGGSASQGGKIYNVNIANNQIVRSQQFGNMPRSFEINNNNIIASSSGGSFVTQFDLNLTLLNDYIDVGFVPGRVSYSSGRFFVCKSTGATFTELSIVDENSLLVTKVIQSFAPVALAINTHGYYLTGKNRKSVYRLDPSAMTPVDSVVLQTTGRSAGDMIKEGESKLLVAVDSSEVWEINLNNNPPTSRLLIPFPGGQFKISAMAFEDLTSMIYIADNQGGPPYFGNVCVYDPASGVQKKVYSLMGRNPVSFAFKN